MSSARCQRSKLGIPDKIYKKTNCDSIAISLGNHASMSALHEVDEHSHAERGTSALTLYSIKGDKSANRLLVALF